MSALQTVPWPHSSLAGIPPAWQIMPEGNRERCEVFSALKAPCRRLRNIFRTCAVCDGHLKAFADVEAARLKDRDAVVDNANR